MQIATWTWTWMRRRRSLALAWTAILLASAACSEARRSKRTRKQEAGVQQPVPPAAPAAPPVEAAPPGVHPGPADAPVGAVPAPAGSGEMTGEAALRITLPGKRRFGAFAFAATWDPGAFLLGEPIPGPMLAGYMCQANLVPPGSIRFNCVGLTGDERGGLLATIPVRFKDRAPGVEDFKVVQNEVVDDMGQILVEVHVELAVDPAKP